MSLAIGRLIRMGVELAFNLTPDAQKSGVYRRSKQGGYNAATGAVVGENLDAPLTYIRTSYSENAVNRNTDKGGDIRIGDQKLIIRMSELGAGGIAEVSTNDSIIEEGGAVYEIVGYKLDPTNQVVTLHARILAKDRSA